MRKAKKWYNLLNFSSFCVYFPWAWEPQLCHLGKEGVKERLAHDGKHGKGQRSGLSKCLQRTLPLTGPPLACLRYLLLSPQFPWLGHPAVQAPHSSKGLSRAGSKLTQVCFLLQGLYGRLEVCILGLVCERRLISQLQSLTLRPQGTPTSPLNSPRHMPDTSSVNYQGVHIRFSKYFSLVPLPSP